MLSFARTTPGHPAERRRPRRSLVGVVAATAVLAATPALLQAPATAKPKDKTVAPLVIGHRGASGYRPEHTLASYVLAIDLGADYIEPDLVSDCYRGEKDPVFVQSFEVGNLQELAGMTKVRLVQLFGGSGQPFDFTVANDPRTYDDLQTPAELKQIATYADGIGPDKGRIIPRTPAGGLGAPTALVGNAHDVGLLVHPYTFRNESVFLPTDLRRGNLTTDYGDAFTEYEAFFAAGVDGLFSDNPDTARLARDEFVTGLVALPAA